MSKTSKRLLLLGATTMVVGLVAEFAYRAMRTEPENPMHFRDAARRVRSTNPVDWAFQQEIQVPWPRAGIPTAVAAPLAGEQNDWFGTGYAMPRDSLTGNATWRPGASFFICYHGPALPYFDQDGCVEYRFNRFGLRDRDDLTLAKPAGVQRIVCLGDSFTLGWGVRQDHNWPVLVEQELQKQWPKVQVINGGGTGSAYVDEYELALRHRHGRFAPDLVVVTLCLNDLLITNGKLCHYRVEALPDTDQPPEARRWWMNSALLRDLARGLLAGAALDLDPARDWTKELMELPATHPWYGKKAETPDIYWVGGTPQRGLRGIRDWCTQHEARVAVVVWPLLQGLGKGRSYPF
ncbi:MAG: GDSL-type esterase/lipase family protein, partial [Planctomycetota bacterium]|nr:GDSL-type esterase/lipase family protein [Planctomycetota bacterium]